MLIKLKNKSKEMDLVTETVMFIRILKKTLQQLFCLSFHSELHIER